jgi:hypothetical protein
MQIRIIMDTITSRADRIVRSVCSRLRYPADIQLVVQTEVGGSAGVVASLSQFLCTDLQTLPQLIRVVSIGQQLPQIQSLFCYWLTVSQQGQVDVAGIETKRQTAGLLKCPCKCSGKWSDKGLLHMFDAPYSMEAGGFQNCMNNVSCWNILLNLHKFH